MEKKSDTYYRERAERRRRLWIGIGIGILTILGGIFLLRNVFYDLCTNSFKRDPYAVVNSYIEAIQTGDYRTVQNCWGHHQFYEVDSGCSKICLEKIMGTSYQAAAVDIEQEQITSAGRAQRIAVVTITCPDSSEQHTARIVLDGVAKDYPWRHWQITNSTFGGPLGDLWCQD